MFTQKLHLPLICSKQIQAEVKGIQYDLHNFDVVFVVLFILASFQTVEATSLQRRGSKTANNAEAAKNVTNS